METTILDSEGAADPPWRDEGALAYGTNIAPLSSI
jgi:hypothetical protein